MECKISSFLVVLKPMLSAVLAHYLNVCGGRGRGGGEESRRDENREKNFRKNFQM